MPLGLAPPRPLRICPPALPQERRQPPLARQVRLQVVDLPEVAHVLGLDVAQFGLELGDLGREGGVVRVHVERRGGRRGGGAGGRGQGDETVLLDLHGKVEALCQFVVR